ncbi:kinetochore Sim4 complex subunit Fta4 [Astrocystis sublimbata]|nr:kinetochore Sim4 complex subunit Fta4 [Astrocystis sublimbata]
MAPPTLIAHKSTFLTTQTLHLSQSLAPSPAWRAANDRAEDGVSARAVDDAMYRLNHILTQHNRRVYAPQASRLVAEQIEGLFYAETQRALRGADDDEEADGDRERLRVGTDYTTKEAISSLPPTWALHKPREAESHPPEARRYTELTESLTTLSTKRQEALERVTRLRRMAALLAPFESPAEESPDSSSLSQSQNQSAAKTTIQDNLVTRNGEIELELERMRLLLARVAGRVAQLPDKNGDKNNNKNKNKNKKRSASEVEGEEQQDSTDLDSLERGKVENLLDQL